MNKPYISALKNSADVFSKINETFISFFGEGIWTAIKAILILIIAFVAATIIKSLIQKLISKTRLKADSPAEIREKMIEFIGKTFFLLVFLLFIPGIFGILGMREVSSPLLNLLNTLWGYLPNILAAILVLWIGFFIAGLVRELLIPIFNKLKINSLQEKAVIKATDTMKISDTLAYIVYVLILIPVIIAAFQALDIQAISVPAIKMLNTIFEFIPNIFAALVIAIIGCIISKFARNIVENMIASSGFDNKISDCLENKHSNFLLSKFIGKTVYAVMVIFFIVESFGVLHLNILTDIGNEIINYMPYMLAAVLILLICYVCNGIIQKSLLKNGHTAFTMVSKVSIYTIGAFMILNELGIAKEIVNTAFILIIAAVSLAFSISFGIGGRDFAGKVLKKFEETFNSNHNSKE